MVANHDGGNPHPQPSTSRRPFSSWSTTTSLWHGLGLFGESYLLFSVGTLRPLWEVLYPSCFDDANYANNDNDNDRQCNRYSYQSITYSVVLGVIVGMVVLGILANTIGRRRGSIITAMLMAGGAFCLTFASIFLSHVPSVLFPILSASLFVFGIGVGGEYPLSASSASERQMAAAAKERHRRHQQLRLQGIISDEFDDDHHIDKVLTPRKSNTTSRVNSNESNCNGGKHEPLILAGGRKTRTTNLATTEKTPPWQTLQVQHHSKQQQLHDIASFGCETEIVTVPPSHAPSPMHIYEGKLADKYFFPSTSSVLFDDCKSSNSLPTNNSDAYIYRGREVLLTFSMQGMGIFVNSIFLTLLLLVSRRTVKDEDDNEHDQDRYYYDIFYYKHTTLLNIWRTTYAIGAAILMYVLVSRILWLTESEVWKQEKDRSRQRRKHNHRGVITEFQPPQLPLGKDEKQTKIKEEVKDNLKNEQPVISPTMSSLTLKSDFDLLGSTNLDGCGLVPAVRTMDDGDDEEGGNSRDKWSTPPSHVKLLFRHYGVRLLGTSMTWLLWDIAYYGNKLFQSSVLIALVGEDVSLVGISSAAAINAFVALIGYYAAAAIVDDPDCGRLTLQQTGLTITGTLFLLCGSFRYRLSSSWLVVMYLGSSFFGQCGPNCTTFLIPAEVFPTNMRTMCHGISASAGKLGALIASILFNFVSDTDFFMISGCASFVALVVTFLTIPDTTTLDLHEIDKQWACIVSRGESKYEGPAIAPEHLSFYERNQNILCCRKR